MRSNQSIAAMVAAHEEAITGLERQIGRVAEELSKHTTDVRADLALTRAEAKRETDEIKRALNETSKPNYGNWAVWASVLIGIGTIIWRQVDDNSSDIKEAQAVTSALVTRDHVTQAQLDSQERLISQLWRRAYNEDLVPLNTQDMK